MPYVIIGGTSFYKRKEIKDIICYLKILINPNDAEAFLRIVNEPPRGLGDVSLNHLRKFSEIEGISIFEAFLNADKCSGLQARAVNSAKFFANMLSENMKNYRELPSSDSIERYIKATGYLDMYKEIGTEESEDRLNNIDELLSDLTRYFNESENSTLEDYLQQLSLVSDIDETDTKQNKLNLMTLHSAKGLEFPVVFIAGLEQGLFPLIRPDRDPAELEEERRLFYVGITRAEKKLYLSYARQRTKFGTVNSQMPSDFLAEIPKKLFEHEAKPKELNTIDDIFKKDKSPKGAFTVKSVSGKEFTIPAALTAERSFNVGDNVRHSQFGKGKITGLSGEGMHRQAVVNFQSVGKKKLMLAFAKLEKI